MFLNVWNLVLDWSIDASQLKMFYCASKPLQIKLNYNVELGIIKNVNTI